MASYKDLGNNKYKIYVELGYNDAGKRIRKTKTVVAKSQRALNKAVTEFEIEARETKNVYLDNITFKKFYEKHFKPLYLENMKLTTQNNYRAVEKTFLNFLGSIQMKKIKPLHIENYFKNEEKEERRSFSVKFQCLKSIFQRAVEWELIENNPVKKIKIKKSKKIDRKQFHYSSEQLKILFNELEHKASTKLKLQVKLACMCGMRKSEIAALTIEAVNINDRVITIDKNLQRKVGTGKHFIQTPKTDASRIVGIPDTLIKELNDYIISIKELKLQTGHLWDQQYDNNGNKIHFIFCNTTGKPNSTNLIGYTWNYFLRNNSSLPFLNFHGLRHTCATLLVQSGANINVVQELLGHTNVAMTINRYTHTDVDDIKDALNFFNSV